MTWLFYLKSMFIQVTSYRGIPGKEKTHKDHVIFEPKSASCFTYIGDPVNRKCHRCHLEFEHCFLRGNLYWKKKPKTKANIKWHQIIRKLPNSFRVLDMNFYLSDMNIFKKTEEIELNSVQKCDTDNSKIQ